MPTFGPIYCETGHAIGFLAEPVNAATSIIPLIAAAAILFYIYRHNVQVWYLHLLALLLTLTGIGSFLWHGLRTPWALSLDILPGLAALLLFGFAWALELKNRWFGYGIIAGLLGLQMLFALLIPPGSGPFFLVSIFSAVVVVGFLLTFFTFQRGRVLGWFGTLVLGLALTGAVFRTVDLFVCNVIPFGTHFLWHAFLSLAVFVGALFLMRLRMYT